MTILQTVAAVADHAEVLARSEKANHFLAVARAMMASRALNMSWSEYAEAARLPVKVADVLKSGVAPISTTTAAALFAPMATAFVESLRYASVFDRIWPFAVHVPLNSIAVNIVTAFTTGSVNEGNAKPATQLALANSPVLPVKVAGLVAATAELLEFSTPAAIQLFDSTLRQAVTIACNTRLLVDLLALTTPIPSSGTTGANVLTDLGALLEAIPVGENSRLFLVLSGDDAKGLLTKTNAAGLLAFPKVNLATGGEVLPGIGLIITNALPAGAALMIDAGGLLLGDEGITLDNSRNASLQLETVPDNPTSGSTVLLNLWQRNMLALRAERSFAFSLGRANAVASLSGVDY
jgi:hypothetical protein